MTHTHTHTLYVTGSGRTILVATGSASVSGEKLAGQELELVLALYIEPLENTVRTYVGGTHRNANSLTGSGA